MGSHLWFPSSPPNLNLDRPRSSAISRLHLIGSLLWSFPLGTLSGTFMDLIMLLFLRTSLFLIGLDVLSQLEHIQSSKSFTLRNGFPHNFNSLFPLENSLNWLRCKCASGMSTRTVKLGRCLFHLRLYSFINLESPPWLKWFLLHFFLCN
jgi:hypothetical protein